MKQCKACLEMYNLPGHKKWGEIRFFGEYCPKCGTFNSDFNKNAIISFIIFILIAVILYLMGVL